jgi:hypothetical protein
MGTSAIRQRIGSSGDGESILLHGTGGGGGRAHSVDEYVNVERNAFVSGMDWALSARHPRVDICDRLATIGMGGQP